MQLNIERHKLSLYELRHQEPKLHSGNIGLNA